MPTNFQQWNPSQANQDTDAEYSADSQRVGGAPDGVPFPAKTANKLFYQSSTGITALMQMMSNKGFTVNDTNIGTLASVLSAIQTTADLRGGLQVQAYSPSINFNASQFSALQVTLSGDIVVNVTGLTPGQITGFIFIQDSAGGHHVGLVGFPGIWSGATVDTSPNSTTIFFSLVSNDGVGHIIPFSSTNGIVGTPIGRSNPLDGTFTNLVASVSATIANLIANGGGTLNGNFGGNPNFTGSVTDSTLTVSSSATVNNLTANNGNLNGSFGGNPTLAGSVTLGAGFTGNPAPNDNSTQIPNTNWVQALVASLIGGATGGLALNLNFPNGYIVFPNAWSNFCIQWARGFQQSTSPGPQTVFFPRTFPNACLAVIPASIPAFVQDTQMPLWVLISFDSSSATLAMNRQADHGFIPSTPALIAIGF